MSTTPNSFDELQRQKKAAMKPAAKKLFDEQIKPHLEAQQRANSFDAELDKIVIIKSDLKGLKSHVATLKSYPAAKQALKSLCLTHRNAELEKLLEQAEEYQEKGKSYNLAFTTWEHRAVTAVPVSAIKDLMEEK